MGYMRRVTQMTSTPHRPRSRRHPRGALQNSPSADLHDPVGAQAFDVAHRVALFIAGQANYERMDASLQRSHRFSATHLFAMERMALASGRKTSEVIDAVIHAGLDAISRHLPPENWLEFNTWTTDQAERMKRANPSYSPTIEAMSRD